MAGQEAADSTMEEQRILQGIRKAHPVIHAITNPVTIHDVVNMILAAGATAICADSAEEAADITAICDGLLLNTGMPDDDRLEAMLRAGRKANEKGIPVVLDPVGAGASPYRRRFLRKLLSDVQFSCIRCNMSEAAALSGMTFASHGVEDAGVKLTPEQMQQLAGEYRTVLAITGETDYTVTRDQIVESHTGTPLEKEITGAGCMLSGVAAAVLAAADSGETSVAGRSLLRPAEIRALLGAYGSCAEAAKKEMEQAGERGTATFRIRFMDAVSIASGVSPAG